MPTSPGAVQTRASTPLQPAQQESSSPEATTSIGSDLESVNEVMQNFDTFNLIMQKLSRFERCSARRVNQDWNRLISQGAGVPKNLRVPSLPTGKMRGLLNSQEVAHAHIIDASTMAIRSVDYLNVPSGENGLSRSYGISDYDLEALAPSQSVRAIDVKVNPGLRDDAVKIIAHRFPNLEYLCLHACSDAVLEGLAVLAQKATELKSIMVTHSAPSAIHKITDFVKVAGSRLEAICVGGFPNHQLFRQLFARVPTVHPSQVLDQLPRVIASACPKLERLALPWHSTLTEDQLQSILTSCPKITQIHIASDLLTPAFVEKILREHPRLEKVTLGNANNLPEWVQLEKECDRVQVGHSVVPWWSAEMEKVKQSSSIS